MIRSYIVEIININKPDFPARVTTKAGHFRQREKKLEFPATKTENNCNQE